MLQYFQTTTLILLWCVLISCAWGVVFYLMSGYFKGFGSFSWSVRGDKEVGAGLGFFYIVPTLLLAPLLIYMTHNIFELTVIFPVASLASFRDILLSSSVPAVVLAIATGLLVRISRNIMMLKQVFYPASFVKLSIALGLSPERQLFKLVYTKSLVDAWVSSLPWIFGELLIIEALFNAPGLGLDIWHQAKMRNLEGFFSSIIWLMGIYFIFFGVSFFLSKKIGHRLEGYSL